VRRIALLLSLAAASPALTACQPAVHAAVGVGYDQQGRLVAAISVCDEDVTRALLQTDSPTGLVVQWHRDSSLHGSEMWALESSSDGHWTADGAGVAKLDARTEYSLWALQGEEGSNQGHVVFRSDDLAGLRPGQLLVSAHHPARVIDADQLATEGCGLNDG